VGWRCLKLRMTRVEMDRLHRPLTGRSVIRRLVTVRLEGAGCFVVRQRPGRHHRVALWRAGL